MSEYPIVPLPFGLTSPIIRAEERWPFMQLEVGEGFYVTTQEAANAQPAASRVGKCNGRKFSSKRLRDGRFFIYRRM